MTDEVEVWLDADFLERMRVGTLSHDRGTLRFAYDPVWLNSPRAFALDPDLSLGEWYVESKDRGRAIVAEVLNETRHWRREAETLRIARADIELTATAFAESDFAHN